MPAAISLGNSLCPGQQERTIRETEAQIGNPGSDLYLALLLRFERSYMVYTNEPQGIQGLWIGSALSAMEQLSIRSFLANRHQYHLYTYGPVAGIPSGTTVHDGNEILPATMIFQYRDRKSYAGFSNYFRYKLLLEKGGWWSDLDMVCLKPLDHPGDYVFAAAQHENVSKERVATGLIKVPRASAIMGYAWEVCLSKDAKQITWGETGPLLLDAAVRKFALQQDVRPASVFCPIPYYRWQELIIPRKDISFSENTYTVHLWNEMWRRSDADKNKLYPQSCIYERLKTLYANWD
jgi:hypothetical protein